MSKKTRPVTNGVKLLPARVIQPDRTNGYQFPGLDPDAEITAEDLIPLEVNARLTFRWRLRVLFGAQIQTLALIPVRVPVGASQPVPGSPRVRTLVEPVKLGAVLLAPFRWLGRLVPVGALFKRRARA